MPETPPLAHAEPAARAADHETPRTADRLAMERMVLFTDAVFAIVITLLALEIRLPESAFASEQALRHGLSEVLAKVMAYVISFLVTALFWAGHLRKFRHIHALHRRLVAFNLLHLMVIGLMPFATGLLSETGLPLTVMIYAGVQCLAVLTSWLTRAWASAHPALLHPGVGEPERRIERRVHGVAFVVFAASIGLATFGNVAMLSWLLLWPGLTWARRPSA